MSEHIPAWKRIGLKVKEELAVDPLSVAAHIDTSDLQSKQAKKKLEKRARAESRESSEKKPPKRQKVPKSERAPPPERDQLVYLKQYTDDKDNWKFSKQKQNWILKHVKVIEDVYEPYLIKYFEGLQGGSQDRMVEVLRSVVQKWNEMQSEMPQKTEEKANAEGDEDDEIKAAESEAKAELEKTKKKDDHDELTSVDADYAIRAKKLITAMIEEEIVLKGIDDVERPEDTAENKEDTEQPTVEKESSEESTSDSTSDSAESSPESSSSPAEEVNAEESMKEEESEPVQPQTTTKKHKKEKKASKKKSYNNLSIEQVEATEWVSPDDYVDAPADEVTEETVEIETEKKSKKSKKEKKDKKGKKKEETEE